MNEPDSIHDTLNIKVKVDIPPGSTTNPTPDQVSFEVDKPTIVVNDSDKMNHRLSFQLSGVYDDGSPYPKDCLMLRPEDGIRWYTADEEEAYNPDFDFSEDQKDRLARWLDNHQPTVYPGQNPSARYQAAGAALNWAGLHRFLPQDTPEGSPFKLSFKIGIQVCAVDDAEHPWVQVDDDPEVDIEMHA